MAPDLFSTGSGIKGRSSRHQDEIRCRVGGLFGGIIAKLEWGDICLARGHSLSDFICFGWIKRLKPPWLSRLVSS